MENTVVTNPVPPPPPADEEEEAYNNEFEIFFRVFHIN
jgi:hypothetical protein